MTAQNNGGGIFILTILSFVFLKKFSRGIYVYKEEFAILNLGNRDLITTVPSFMAALNDTELF